MLTESFKAIETITEVLWKLKHVSEYRTEKYIDRDLGYEDTDMTPDFRTTFDPSLC